MSGGGGGGGDVNDVSTSQAELWRQQANKWNKFIIDIEPRQEAAFKASIEDPTRMMTSAVKGAVYDKHSPDKAFEDPKSLNTQKFLRGEAELGGALSGAETTAREAAKDYKANTISNILASKMGEQSSINKGLSAAAAQEAQTYTDTVRTNQAIDFGNTQAGSAGAGALATGVYSGYRDKEVKSALPTSKA